jgi:hypothetical protein
MVNVFIVTGCDVEVGKAFRENKDMAEYATCIWESHSLRRNDMQKYVHIM